MGSRVDLGSLPTQTLLDGLEVACTEKGILIADSAGVEELNNAQRTVDRYMQELNRRMAW